MAKISCQGYANTKLRAEPSTVFSCRDGCQAAVVLVICMEREQMFRCGLPKAFQRHRNQSPLFKRAKNYGSDPLRYTGPKLLGFEGEIRHLITLTDLSLYLLRSWYQTRNLAFQISI